MPKSAAAKSNSAASMAKYLSNVLSDTYLLTIKTHGYHWNVEGPLFHQLHLLLEGQYKGLFEAADEMAERIRALGFPALGSPTAFRNHTVVKDAADKPPKAMAMLADLVKTHEAVRDRVEEARSFANDIGDAASEDMLIGRLEDHDKILWMLKSHLD
jgi:starvation-inducible DNA-binding protein